MSLFVLTMTLNILYYFETGILFDFGLSEMDYFTIPISLIVLTFTYFFFLELFRLGILDDFIDEIMVDNKTDLKYIKERYSSFTEICTSFDVIHLYYTYKSMQKS